MDFDTFDGKTWAQFNTWFALRNKKAKLSDFAAAWEEYNKELERIKLNKIKKIVRKKISQ